ncbi:hypothetical protein [Vreelandella olivaria]|uniref:hypothetical protein n=1 Tax=Vreelandella olivaria TaxID=390919 RepID=UPI00201EEC73|nr:hypothetical protein [Halomonas olivaria]
MSFTQEENIEKIESLGDQELHALLRAWIDAQHEYSALHSSFDLVENGWWHNERASISLLAGAAWKSGWVALEEFGATKRGHRENEERTDRVGRCDLYVCNKEVSLAIEAKQSWQGIGVRVNDITSNVNEKLQEAWDDAGYLHSYEADRRFAVTFIVPYLPISEVWDEGSNKINSEQIKKRILNWLDEIEDFQKLRKKPVQYAFHFPADGYRYINEFTRRVFPGVVMVMEERFRGH